MDDSSRNTLNLVLRRASGNSYEIKGTNASISERPKREASQKVKFTYSDQEEDDDEPYNIPKKKQISNIKLIKTSQPKE